MPYSNPSFLLQEFLKFPSVTPYVRESLSFLEKIFHEMGFIVFRPTFSDGNNPDVENLYAKKGNDSPHLMFAGHADVVSPGDTQKWIYPPFSGRKINGIIYGRGAVDMKGSIVCFISALCRILKKQTIHGTVCFLITGDEEGPAINGTNKLLKWAIDHGEKWEAALVGEPTSKNVLGDTIKIGRRGSLSGILTINGHQGHVAYPNEFRNPIPFLCNLLDKFIKDPLDSGNSIFPKSNIELVNIDSYNKMINVIPRKIDASFNVRFNDFWCLNSLKEEITNRIQKISNKLLQENPKYISLRHEIKWLSNPSSCFITKSNSLINMISTAILKSVKIYPKTSTDGGTSDARFIKDYCPVIEFGLIGKKMHQINESIEVDQLESLTKIYQDFIEIFFK